MNARKLERGELPEGLGGRSSLFEQSRSDSVMRAVGLSRMASLSEAEPAVRWHPQSEMRRPAGILVEFLSREYIGAQ
jgi:hypothetical protein